MAVDAGVFEGHVIGAQIAFFKYTHLDAARLCNLFDLAMYRPAIAEKQDGINLSFLYQPLEKGRPLVDVSAE